MRTPGGWAVPAGLIALGLVPVVAGVLRVGDLPGEAAHGVPLALHVTASPLYTVLGAFQFASGFRRRRRGWHRAAGRVLVVAGLVAALSAVWMTLFAPLPPRDAGLLTAFRLVFGTLMAVALVRGFAAVRRRDVRRHRAWMTRAYAIGLGAGTQAFTLGIWEAAAGPPDAFARALLQAAGWVINLAVAEWGIRRSAPHPAGLVRPHGDLHPVAEPELGHQAGDVTLDRAE
ncbi:MULTISPECIES: DUF2306 domain-containing protein [Nonomuraea]|uniref:DUF2306 domain-containing protein n=1 Tax=Nonomuraea salmonea TaxID=46181 RepID=A0ABV5P4Q8_9ACTN